MPGKESSEGSNEPIHRRIQALLRIQPKGDCFMDHLDGDVSDVEISFYDGKCHCEVILCRQTDEGLHTDIHHHNEEICTNCPGMIFQKYGLMPRFLEREEQEFIIRTYLPQELRITEFVEDLRSVSEKVQVLRIMKDLAEDSQSLTREIDISQLTQKQRDTLEFAIEAGYYDFPKQVSLEDLAEAFDLSKSAMFQRVARAEQAVMKQVFEV